MKFFLVCFLLGFNLLLAQMRLTFREALIRIPGGNTELNIERYKLGFSEADITAARIRNNPVVNNQFLNLTNQKNWVQGTQALSSLNRQVWYQLTKPIMINNIRGKRIDLAEKGKTISEVEIEEKKRQLLYDCGVKWMDLWHSTIDLQLIQVAQGYLDTLITESEKKLKAGSITQEDMFRTKLLSDHFEVELMGVLQNYQNELGDMQIMLGISDSIYVEDDEREMNIPIPSLDSLIQFALKNRPDLSLEKENVEFQKCNRTLQRASRAPYMELGMIYNPQNTTIYAGTFATLAIPVFDRNQDEVQRSEVSLEQSKLSMGYKETLIKNEVTKAYRNYKTSLLILKKHEMMLGEYIQVYTTIHSSYIKGETSLVDFLEAHKTYLEIQEEHHERKYNFRKSILEVLYSSSMISTY